MPSIHQRLTDLEQKSHASADIRTREERDAAVMAAERALRPIARTCSTPEELANHMRGQEVRCDDRVVSLDERRRADAVLAAMARIIFERSRLDSGLA